MSINYIGAEEISRRKTISDKKNDTDDLTFFNSNKQSSHGEAAKENRDRREELSLIKLIRRTDIDDLLEYDLEE